MLSLLSLLSLLVAPAHAGQTVTGDYLRISYYDTGNWAWGRAGAGVEAWLGGDWVDFTWPGDAHAMFALEFDEGGVAQHHYADSYSGVTTMTVTGETDASTAADAIAVYTYQAGSLEVTKTETWRLDGYAVVVQFELANVGSADLTNLRLLFATDPDPDHATTEDFDTLNDVVDSDGDGLDDYVESVGPSTGYTMGFGACEAALTTMGHYPDWLGVVDADQALTDEAGGRADDAVGLRYTVPGTLVAGDTLKFSFVVTMGETGTEAWTRYDDALPRCDCDADEDGYESEGCGGDDCDDEDPGANITASEVWYDGVDQDCDGNDDDQDGDGHPVGTDCDDTAAGVNPSAVEVCDGVDNDCDGAVDEGCGGPDDSAGGDDSGRDTDVGGDSGRDTDTDGGGDSGRDTDRPDSAGPDDSARPDTDPDTSTADDTGALPKDSNPPKCGAGSGAWLLLALPLVGPLRRRRQPS